MESEKTQSQLTDSGRDETTIRTESKRCLNCGSVLTGHYCSQCGQKDEDLHEPAWKLFADAFADFWHFDSKFLITFYPLLFKPGYLTKEYAAGRRARYVHPIRLYFFISVIFFLAYFTFSPQKFFEQKTSANADSTLHQKVAGITDSTLQIIGNDNVRLNINNPKIGKADSLAKADEDHLPATVQLYEDSIHKLSKDSMPGFFQQLFDKKRIDMKQRGSTEVLKEISEIVNHNLPKIMFILLPVFALLLKLLYIRRKVYFVDHAVFSLHFHAFAFILFLLMLLISILFPAFVWGGWAFLVLLVYLFIGLRKVYHQSFRKTLLKVFLLLFSYGLFIGLTVMLLIGYAALVL